MFSEQYASLKRDIASGSHDPLYLGFRIQLFLFDWWAGPHDEDGPASREIHPRPAWRATGVARDRGRLIAARRLTITSCPPA